jgi:uncharacterized repeat protein (TIGR01451 family)
MFAVVVVLVAALTGFLRSGTAHANGEFTVKITGFPLSLAAGSSQTFTVSVTNATTGGLDNVQLSDSVDLGSLSLPNNSPCSIDPQTGVVTCQVGHLDAGARSSSFSITVHAASAADCQAQNHTTSCTITNRADASDPPATDTGTDSAAASEDVPNLSVSIPDLSDIEVGHGPEQFTATVGNSGSGDATQVIFSASGLAQAGALTLSSSGGSCNNVTHTCDLGTVAAGGSSKTVTISVVLPSIGDCATAATAAHSTKCAVGVDGTATDFEGYPSGSAPEDTGSAAVTFPDLRLVNNSSGTPTPSPAQVATTNQTVTFTYTLSNIGSGPATSTSVGNALPSQGTLKSVTYGSTSCTSPPSPCSLSTLAPGATDTLTVVVNTPNEAACSNNQSPSGSGKCIITDTPTATDSEGDPTPSDATATQSDDVLYPDLTLAFGTAPPSDIGVSTDVSYTFVVKNAGTGDATNTTLTQPLTPGIALNSATFTTTNSNSGNCSFSNRTITCLLLTLRPADPATSRPADTATITVSVHTPATESAVGSPTTGVMVTAATVFDDQGEPSTGNKHASPPLSTNAPTNESVTANTKVHDAFKQFAVKNDMVQTAGLGSTRQQQEILNLPGLPSGKQFLTTIDDTANNTLTSSAFTNCGFGSYATYGSVAHIETGAAASSTTPNIITLMYSSSPSGGIPIQKPLGQIEVFRFDTALAPPNQCLEEPKCVFKSNAYFLPKGVQACIQTISRQTPSGIVTITTLDITDDPYVHSGG